MSGGIQRGKSCRCFNGVCEAAAFSRIMTLSDIIISITVWSKWVCISNFSSSKQAPEIPAFSLKELPYISWSPKCFLWQPLLFLAPLFHLSDCLSFSSPPQPASVCHSNPFLSLSPFSPSSSLSASLTLPNVPLSFPLGFFLLYLLHMAPPGAILEQKGGAGEILWPGKLHLIFCIHAKAISPTGVYWCGPLLIAVSLLFYLGGG